MLPHLGLNIKTRMIISVTNLSRDPGALQKQNREEYLSDFGCSYTWYGPCSSKKNTLKYIIVTELKQGQGCLEVKIDFISM